MHWGYGWGMGVWGWFWMVIFWIFIILGVVFLIRLFAGGTRVRNNETPLDIIKKRYARGEITKEEYERMKEDLQ